MVGEPDPDATISGFDAKTWSSMGASDLILPSVEGLGIRPVLATTLVAEQLGRQRYQGPQLEATVVADVVRVAGAAGPLADIHARLARAETIITVGLDALAPNPGESDDRLHATVDGTGRRLDGTIRFLRFAADSAYILIRASGSAGDELLLVATDAPGLRLRQHDDLGAGELYQARLSAVPVPGEAVVRSVPPSGPHWSVVVDTARVRQAAYLVGLAGGALDEAVRYATRRRQFGRPIATFQSMSFRLAAMVSRLEACRLFAYYAAAQADEGSAIDRIAPQALALAGKLAREITAEAIHIHGAIGMTQRAKVADYYRLAAVAGCLMGAPNALLRAAAASLAQEPGSVRFATATTGPVLPADLKE